MMFSYPGAHYQPSAVMRGHSHHSHHTFGNKFIGDIPAPVVSHNNNNNNNSSSVSVKCEFDSNNSLLTTTSTITAINSMGSSLQSTNQLNHHNIGLSLYSSSILFLTIIFLPNGFLASIGFLFLFFCIQ